MHFIHLKGGFVSGVPTAFGISSRFFACWKFDEPKHLIHTHSDASSLLEISLVEPFDISWTFKGCLGLLI